MDTTEAGPAAYRARYEILRANGQEPRSLPPTSARPAPRIAATTAIWSETIAGGWYWKTSLKTGEILRLQLEEKPAAVSLLAWRAADPVERLNVADTMKVQWTAKLRRGRLILSDMGRVMLSIVEDSCGCHDVLVGGSTAQSNMRRYGEVSHRNTRDNFVLAAQKLGLCIRDVPPCISFFAPVGVDEQGRFQWYGDRRTGGDFVDLRAEMDLLVAISNCPHPLDPSSLYQPPTIEVTRYRGETVGANDLCRTATDEARRGFENNAAADL